MVFQEVAQKNTQIHDYKNIRNWQIQNKIFLIRWWLRRLERRTLKSWIRHLSHLLSRKKTPLLSRKKTCLLSRKRTRLLSRKKTCLLSRKKTLLLSRKKTHLLSRKETRVLSRRRKKARTKERKWKRSKQIDVKNFLQILIHVSVSLYWQYIMCWNVEHLIFCARIRLTK